MCTISFFFLSSTLFLLSPYRPSYTLILYRPHLYPFSWADAGGFLFLLGGVGESLIEKEPSSRMVSFARLFLIWFDGLYSL